MTDPKIVKDQFVQDILRQDIKVVSTNGVFQFAFNSPEQKNRFIKLIAEARLWEERTHGAKIGGAKLRRDRQFYSVTLDESSVDNYDFIHVHASGPLHGWATLAIFKDLLRPYTESYQKENRRE